jgi:hypothetical protein
LSFIIGALRSILRLQKQFRRNGLNTLASYGIYHGVRKLKTVMALLLALAWLPLTSHCLLESLTESELISCCAASSSESDDCSDKGCCSVESAYYQSLRHDDHAPAPVILLLSVVSLPPMVEHALPDEVRLGILTAAPPEHARTWHFVSRTALPVRAPSFLS